MSVYARLKRSVESEPGLRVPLRFIPNSRLSSAAGAVIGDDSRINVAANFHKATLRKSLCVNSEPRSPNEHKHTQRSAHWRKFSRVKSPLFIERLYCTLLRLSTVRLFLVKSTTATLRAVQIPSIDSTSRYAICRTNRSLMKLSVRIKKYLSLRTHKSEEVY